jgi:hypothetical protein
MISLCFTRGALNVFERRESLQGLVPGAWVLSIMKLKMPLAGRTGDVRSIWLALSVRSEERLIEILGRDFTEGDVTQQRFQISKQMAVAPPGFSLGHHSSDDL